MRVPDQAPAIPRACGHESKALFVAHRLNDPLISCQPSAGRHWLKKLIGGNGFGDPKPCNTFTNPITCDGGCCNGDTQMCAGNLCYPLV
jgi:hypothetical protein